MVTLTATWLNSTVIIRKMAGYLAVTVKVTGQLAFESDGLCSTRCPANQYVGQCYYLSEVMELGEEGREKGEGGRGGHVIACTIT